MGIRVVGDAPGLKDSSTWLHLKPKDGLTLMDQRDGSRTARFLIPVKSLNSEIGKGKDLLANVERATIGPPFVAKPTEVTLTRVGSKVSFEIPDFKYGGTGTAPITLDLKLRNGQMAIVDVGSQKTRLDSTQPQMAGLEENIATMGRVIEHQRTDVKEVEAGLAQAKNGFAPVPEWLHGYDARFSAIPPEGQEGQWPVAAIKDTIKNMSHAIEHDEKLLAKDTRELEQLQHGKGHRNAWTVKTPGDGWKAR